MNQIQNENNSSNNITLTTTLNTQNEKRHWMEWDYGTHEELASYIIPTYIVYYNNNKKLNQVIKILKSMNDSCQY